MPDTLEDLTYDYEDEGVLVRKQIDRAVLTKGGWATVMFLFQELDRAKGKFRPPKMAIVTMVVTMKSSSERRGATL